MKNLIIQGILFTLFILQFNINLHLGVNVLFLFSFQAKLILFSLLRRYISLITNSTDQRKTDYSAVRSPKTFLILYSRENFKQNFF